MLKALRARKVAHPVPRRVAGSLANLSTRRGEHLCAHRAARKPVLMNIPAGRPRQPPIEMQSALRRRPAMCFTRDQYPQPHNVGSYP